MIRQCGKNGDGIRSHRSRADKNLTRALLTRLLRRRFFYAGHSNGEASISDCGVIHVNHGNGGAERHERLGFILEQYRFIQARKQIAAGLEIVQGAFGDVEQALGSQSIQGHVQGISREVSTTGRTGTIVIALPGSVQHRLRPGLSAR